MSLRKAVNTHCKSCLYDPLGGAGTWRQQVEACTSCKCALFPYRPKPTNAKKQQFKRTEDDLSPKRVVATNDGLIAVYDARNAQIAPSILHKGGELS